MAKQYEGQDPLVLAAQAERELGSQGAKQGHDLAGDMSSAGPRRSGPHGTGNREGEISDSSRFPISPFRLVGSGRLVRER